MKVKLVVFLLLFAVVQTSHSYPYKKIWWWLRQRPCYTLHAFDLLFGYNLLAIAHYDLNTEKLNSLFDKPVLIKSLYYPSFEQDSIDKKPINRNNYMVSVYDQDTNRDTLINRLDLRRFYSFNVSGQERIQLVPPNYSVERSQYDSQNDVMYIYARLDTNQKTVRLITKNLYISFG